MTVRTGPELLARVKTELGLPVSGFVQGEVARIGVRMLVDGDRIDLLVSSVHAHHLRDRIRADCAELLR